MSIKGWNFHQLQKQIRNQHHIDLHRHTVDVFANQTVEFEMHLQKFPKKLNLPSVAIDFTNLLIRQLIQISGKPKFTLALSVAKPNDAIAVMVELGFHIVFNPYHKARLSYT